MPEDLNELKKVENLSEIESKIVKILLDNKGKPFDFIDDLS